MRPTLEGRLLSPDPLTYRAAGVDITAGDEAVRRIARLAAFPHRPEVLGGVGAFAAFCLAVRPRDAAPAAAPLRAAGEQVFELGEIRAGACGVEYV